MAPAAEAMVSLIQATIGTVLGPLMAEMAAQRQTNERQAERLAALEREAGRLSSELEATAGETIALKVRESRLLADLDAARAELAAARAPGLPPDAPGEPAPAETATDAPDALKPRWHALWPLLTFWTVAALVLVVVGALLFWPR